ncbi:MAG: hypothetical protein ACOYBC_08255 [Bilifractor sp.]|jgi:hypothetical protein
MSKFFRRFLGTVAGGTAALTLAVKPRISRKPDMHEIERYDYANHGFTGRDGKLAKDSPEAFQAAIDHGYGIRTKVQSDRQLKETLDLIDGQVPVILTVEPEKQNLYRFCEKLFHVLDEYEGVFAIDSINPQVLNFFRTQREEYIRGQILDSSYTTDYSFLGQLSDFAVRNLLMNFRTQPDFISCSMNDRKKFSLRLCRLVYRVHIADFVVRDIHEYEDVRCDGQIVIFEDMEP